MLTSKTASETMSQMVLKLSTVNLCFTPFIGNDDYDCMKTLLMKVRSGPDQMEAALNLI